MKVAIVLNTSWNIYNFRLGLIQALQDQGHEVFAIAPIDEYSPKLEAIGCKYYEVKMDSRGANPIKDLALIFELFNIYRKVKPDVVLHYTIKPNIYGTLAATLLNIPVVNNVCGLGTAFLQKNFLSRIVVNLYRFAFRFPRKIFFQNEYDKEFFISRKLIRPNVADIVPGSGINVNDFKPSNPPKKTKFTFLLISRLIHDKGILEYIDAVRELRQNGLEADFQLLGPKDPKHKRGISVDIIDGWEKQGIVDYLGTADDVRQHIAHADCVVLPSYREGTPRTLLEAASSGKPIVATNVPGCNNVVVDGVNGFLCKRKDSQDLAEKMKKVYGLSEESLAELGQNSRKIAVEQFDEKLVIDKYLSTLSEVDAQKAS